MGKSVVGSAMHMDTTNEIIPALTTFALIGFIVDEESDEEVNDDDDDDVVVPAASKLNNPEVDAVEKC